MKIEFGDGPDIIGTVEVGPSGEYLFEGPKKDVLPNVLTNMARSYPGNARVNKEAFLEWLLTKMSGRFWARLEGTQPRAVKPGQWRSK